MRVETANKTGARLISAARKRKVVEALNQIKIWGIIDNTSLLSFLGRRLWGMGFLRELLISIY